MVEIQNDSTRINASPTKEFFIYTLVRDVELKRSILDLVDNSVDGARRLRPDGDYTGLSVSLEVFEDHFSIIDNCGGISVDVARNSAFRFGRPKNTVATPHSIGEFGVGMKRSIFRLGRYFVVESTTINSKFKVEVDIDQWMSEMPNNEAPDWHFEFSELEINQTIALEDTGTNIVVSNLHISIAQNFKLGLFLSRLREEISLAHAINLEGGLKISLNGTDLSFSPQELLKSEELMPTVSVSEYPRFIIDGIQGEPVKVRIYAGVNPSQNEDERIKDSGWYIFCNGRLVERANKNATSVWGRDHSMPQHHPSFAHFRGYVFFDCEDAGVLPWTTTKTSVDVDSPIYKIVQQKMIEETKPVLEFLKQLDRERKNQDEGTISETPLRNAIHSASPVKLRFIVEPMEFSAPTPVKPIEGEKLQTIRYQKPKDLVEQAKKLLGVTTVCEVGEGSFDYFMQYEGDE